MTKSNDLKVIQNLLYNSLAQAIIRIFENKHLIIRIYLALVSTLLIGIAAYLTIESILSFFSYEVITKSRTVSEAPTMFPKITLCNINMFTSKYASELIRKVNKRWISNFSFFDPEQIKNITIEEIERYFEIIDMTATALIFNENYSDDHKKLLAHSFEDVLISCQFNYQKCDASDFVWSFDPYYGNCYSFNTGFNASGHKVQLKESSVSGWLFGLQLELYVNYNENLTSFNDASGLMVRIGNSSYLTDQNFDGIRVAPGFRTDISISRTFNYMLPQPYSNCLVDSKFKNYESDLFNLILNSPYQYSQKLCLEQCFQRESVRHCNCTASVFVSLFKTTRRCHDLKDVECTISTFSNIYLANDFIKHQCLALCPLECNNSIYTASFSSNVIHGNKYINYIMQNHNILEDFNSKNVDANTASKSVCFLNIYYNSLSYKQTNEIPQMSVTSLLASIGGNLGLFLGVSVFSLSELIEICIEIYFLRSKKKSSNKVESLPNKYLQRTSFNPYLWRI